MLEKRGSNIPKIRLIFLFFEYEINIFKKHEFDSSEILNMGSTSLKNMKWKVGNMGSISSKNIKRFLIFGKLKLWNQET